MNEIILNYIVQAILGGASGYITNDYAINMLFKEYTPLKIGGVIKKTREEFIENLSNLVENDIINKEKLQSILSDESFKKEFEDLTADFYENCLYETAGSNKFVDINGFNLTLQSTDIFVANVINEYMPELYKIFLDNLDINNFLTVEQINSITSSLYSSLTNIIDDTNIVENILLSIYKYNENLSFVNIINENIYKTVIENSVDILFNETEKSNDKINDIVNATGLNDSLKSVKDIFYTKKIKEVVNLDDNVLNILNESLLTYVNSEKGTSFIYSMINSLFSYARGSDKSILNLLDSSFEENLKSYIIDNIPSLTENVIEWINENSHLIDTLIEDSIDEVIKESDGLKAKLLSTIKNTYFNNLSKKYSIVDKIISYVKKVTEPEKLSLTISDKIIDILNNLAVGELVLEAENNNITPDSATSFILNYINKNSKTIISTTAEYISNIEIKKIMPKELSSEIKTNIIKKLYELISSNTAKKYLTDNLINYTRHIVSRELKSILSVDQAESFALKIKDFIKEKAVSNEMQLKIWMEHEIKAVTNELSFKNLSSNAVTLINDEIFKYYKQGASELEDIPISTALDKLNSIDNLARNSSESLRSYAVKNTDVVLSGSIKAIATNNLNKLNDDELVNLANDFIGRELKPIMYFGGVLGVAAGLILAAFQSSPLDLVEINAANMLVYAFVGYLTNVIAINMIFKPYKENKLLSKIPFLKNFSLGYIIKNQKTFAKNTAHFIDNSLLSKKSINMLFDKYRDKIKNSFTESIEANNYKTLISLLTNNRNNVIKSIYAFLKHKSMDNKNNIGSFIYNKISKIKLASLINEKTIDKIGSLLKEKLQGPNINNKIYTLINSENSLEGKLSKDRFKKVIFNVEKNYYDKFIDMISSKDELRYIILNHENKFDDYIDNQINKIIGSEGLETIAKLTANKVNSLALDKYTREQFTNKILKLINKSIDRNETFEELFGGKFKNYVDSKTPEILGHMSTSIISSIKNSKPKIAVMVQSEIKSHLGFIEKGMYTFMGGDEIIDELLTKIIVVKLPKFMEAKKIEFQNIADTLLEEKFFKTKVDVLYTGLNKLQLNELIENYLTQQNTDKIENKINDITKNLFKSTGNLKLKDILNLFNANTLEGLLNSYNNEINSFTNELLLNLDGNKELIIEKIFTLTDSLIDDFMKTQFKKVFNGIYIEDIKHTLDKLFSELNKNDLNKIIYTSLEDVKANVDLNVEIIIDKNEFIKSAENYVITLLENPELENALKEHLGAVIDEALSVNFNFIDDQTKNYILNIFTDSCILSLKRNMDEILKSIKFDEIAKEEIEKMEPEKIHEMFNSFGEKYFKRLMLYGFGGFIFGINMYVGFSLTILKILSELFNNKKLKTEK